MNRFTKNKAFGLSIAFVLWISSTVAVFAQVSTKPTNAPRPLLQPITVQTDKPAATSPTGGANSSSTPLVKKTGSSSPISVAPRRTSIPVLADIDIPGTSGILVESLEGNIVLDSYSNFAFNPASNVKIATAYAVLKTFGPEYRFPTSVWTDGQIDQSTGTLYGNLYVSGRDPMFNLEHAVAVANELNRLGIQNISGDLIVTDNFAMSFSTQAQSSGNALQAVMNSAKRSVGATRAWSNYLTNSKKIVTTIPSVPMTGGVYVQSLPTNARLLFSHESAPMREILKTTLCYSNNFLSERLGDMLGGAYAVARTVQLNAQIAPEEFYIQTSSGLGNNRVTPRAMMKLLRALRSDLERNKMNFTDIMPVAGVDKGTLEGRFDTDFAKGSVVGKTGTLGNTDGGVSSLAGEVQTKNGKLLFVVFNQRGGVNRFRAFQNSLISLIQGQLGGATSLGYNVVPLDVRLANTRITYPDTRVRVNEE
ncbi:MAG: D-alanyl-D-alanine carboxypeptidase [Pyrinomonadaceae bacterium]|nr:D-alanyl-D-alanine carboxypeptidase [Pyrinomonadaceae bacterium]